MESPCTPEPSAPTGALRIAVFESASSTNDTILEAGARGAPEWTVHIARRQTRGRGRADRSWWSPAGAGLWMSVLLRPRAERTRWSGLALVAGRAVELALHDLGVRRVEVYWPNDLVAGGRKLGGILAEVRQQGSAAWVALGIGINIDFHHAAVEEKIPSELKGRITSLVEAGPPSTRDPLALARAILARFRPLYERFQAGESVRAVAGEGAAHPGSRVVIRRVGRPEETGEVVGLGEAGELLVRTRGGAIEALAAGEVLYEHEL